MQIARETARRVQTKRTASSPLVVLRGLSTWERATVVLGAITAAGMMVSLWAIFAYAPTDAIQGVAQRIFYFHVPIAWIAYLAFFIVFVASVVYLWRRDERWDWLARAAAEIGTVFTTLVLITGSLWGKTIWGTWWQWDPRLTTTLILWFIYVGYLMLRSYTGRTASGARAAAVLGIVGFVDVPIDYFSVTWWRNIHPPADYVSNGLPPQALTAFMLALTTFTLFFALLLVLVYQLERVRAAAEKLRGQVEG